MTSTKLIRVHIDPLNNRLTTAEGSLATIESRNLIDTGDNVSELNNDAQYQNATQVDAKITAVVGAAPAALNTLGEIAAALADDDDAIAALVAQDTANATAISDLQTSLAELDASDIPVAYEPVNYLLLDPEDQVMASTVLSHLSCSDRAISFTKQNLQQQITALQTDDIAQNTAIADLRTDVATLQTARGSVEIAYGNNISTVKLINVTQDFEVNSQEDTATISLSNDVFNLNRFALDPVGYPYGDLKGAIDLLLRNNAIRRLNLTEDITLTISDAARQNLINQTADAVTVESPSNPYVGLEFEVINHITSTQNILFAGETIIPGSRHAVQWDGVEWVVM